MKGKGKFCASCPIFGQWKFASFALTSQNGLWLAINVTLKVRKFGLLIWDEGIKDFKQDSSWENPASIGFIWRATLGKGGRVLAVGCCLGLVLTTPPTRGGCIFCPKSGVYTLTIPRNDGVYFGDITNDRIIFWQSSGQPWVYSDNTPNQRTFWQCLQAGASIKAKSPIPLKTSLAYQKIMFYIR